VPSLLLSLAFEIMPPLQGTTTEVVLVVGCYSTTITNNKAEAEVVPAPSPIQIRMQIASYIDYMVLGNAESNPGFKIHL
jgi:hypothetical protein